MKTLKINFVLFVLLFSPVFLTAQNTTDTLFDKYSGKDGVTSVYITQNMFSLFADIDTKEDEEEFTDLVKNLKYIKILSIENDTLGKYKNVNFYDDVMKGKSAGNYEELMVIKKDGKNVNFLITKDGKIIKELLMLVDGKDEKVLISIQGDIDLKMISKLSRTMKIEGLEDLKEIDENEK